ncbi:hypothetical protein GMD78_18200 [Ornithinibacillus sp. L9]|uniref:Uncharacterized protein n=1 Tax=Ornithinibacillus caprae TaxID=2678566 RepID=A0A6N8FRC0_9BACI|nr:hypothetical protein [Ornithinibacillus caprae]MUK90308.1 hypothetical protein [Ornithinibacillus caprae]
MEETISLNALNALVEKKIKKKILIKLIWNENEKITLFITPNMKINSFIYDDKEGYLFYDMEGNLVKNSIPCILTEDKLEDGKINIEKIKNNSLLVNNQPLSNEDIVFLKEYHT